MLANARWNPSVVDTLPKRVISGLEVIPIKKAFESGEVLWRLRVSDFKECFQRFESSLVTHCLPVCQIDFYLCKST